MKVRSDTFLIVLLSTLTLLVCGAVFYVLYTAHPDAPIFNVQEKGYKVSLAADTLASNNMPVEVLRDDVPIKTIESSDDLFLEYLLPGTYTYTVRYTAQNMLGMDQRMEDKKNLVVSKIPNKELPNYFDLPKVQFTTKGYSVYVSSPDMKTFSRFDIFEKGELVKSISREDATTTTFLEYFSPGIHSFEVAFTGDVMILNDVLRQDYEVDVGTIAALREEGYKVLVSIQNLNGITSPVIISRDGRHIKSFRKEGEYVLEYVRPGEYTYGVGYNIRDASGEDKKLEISKRLLVSEYTKEELEDYYNFPTIDLVTENYSVYASSSNTHDFSEIKVFEDGNLLNILTLKDGGKTFLEHLSLGKHDLEVVFVNKETKKIEDLLRKDYEAEVAPIPPVIESLVLTPFIFKNGYSSDVALKVSNAATCTADLIFQQLGSTTTKPSVLKSHAFRGGEGFDYFSSYTEKWSWKEILLPVSPSTMTGGYDMKVRVTCNDHYNAKSTEVVQKLQTADLVYEDSVVITYTGDSASTTNGEIYNTMQNDFLCTLLLNDDTSNMLDRKEFSLLGHQTYKFDVSQYEKDLLTITVTCDNVAGDQVVKTSEFRKQEQLSLGEEKREERQVVQPRSGLASVFSIFLRLFGQEK